MSGYYVVLPSGDEISVDTPQEVFACSQRLYELRIPFSVVFYGKPPFRVSTTMHVYASDTEPRYARNYGYRPV